MPEAFGGEPEQGAGQARVLHAVAHDSQVYSGIAKWDVRFANRRLGFTLSKFEM